MSIHVTDFAYEKGKNDAKYIELLEKALKNEQRISSLAVEKVRKLSKENQEIRASAIDEFVNMAWRELGSDDRDIYARESIIELAEKMKSKSIDKENDENERNI